MNRQIDINICRPAPSRERSLVRGLGGGIVTNSKKRKVKINYLSCMHSPQGRQIQGFHGQIDRQIDRQMDRQIEIYRQIDRNRQIDEVSCCLNDIIYNMEFSNQKKKQRNCTASHWVYCIYFLTTYLFIYSSNHLSIYLFTYLSVSLSIYSYINIYQ